MFMLLGRGSGRLRAETGRRGDTFSWVHERVWLCIWTRVRRCVGEEMGMCEM
jgi:hypothetical protein